MRRGSPPAAESPLGATPTAEVPPRRIPWEAAGLALVAILSITPVVSDDVWIYLKTGELTLASGRILSTDDFSFTLTGARWVNHEWLANLVFFGAHQVGGPWGLIALRCALLLAMAGLLLRMARRAGTPAPIAALLLAATAFAMSDRFIDRAHLFNFVAVAAYVDALLGIRDGVRTPRWRLPLIQLVWVNLHSGAVLGPILVGLALAAAAMRALVGRRPVRADPQVRRLVVELAAVVLASLANPYFADSLLYPLQQAGFDLYRKHVYEWMPISAPAYAGSWMQILFWTCVVAVAFVIALPRRFRAEEVLFAGLFFTMALSAARFTAKFELVAFPLIAARLRDAVVSRLARIAIGGVMLAGAFGLIFAGNPIRGPIRTFGGGVDMHVYPEGACRILENSPAPVRLFNQYDMGSYLIWRLHPRVRVFIDGRNQVYPEAFYARYLASNDAPQNFAALEREFGLDAVLLYNEPGANIPAFLTARPDWKLVWFDDSSVLFLKDRPDREEVLASHTYRLYSPIVGAPGNNVANALGADPALFIRELERAASEAPFAIRPRKILAHALRARGRAEDAARVENEIHVLETRFRTG